MGPNPFDSIRFAKPKRVHTLERGGSNKHKHIIIVLSWIGLSYLITI